MELADYLFVDICSEGIVTDVMDMDFEADRHGWSINTNGFLSTFLSPQYVCNCSVAVPVKDERENKKTYKNVILSNGRLGL